MPPGQWSSFLRPLPFSSYWSRLTVALCSPGITDALAPDTNRHLFVRSFTSPHLGISRVRVRVRFRFHFRSLPTTSSSYLVAEQRSTDQRRCNSLFFLFLLVSSLEKTDRRELAKNELVLQSAELAYRIVHGNPFYSTRIPVQLILVKTRRMFAEYCSRNRARAGASIFVIDFAHRFLF